MNERVKMILGTVQLGMEYGIGNTAGKPSYEEAFSLLDYAYHNGILMLDTAQAYGDSEQIIGQYHSQTGNIFRICTKLPVDMPEIAVGESLSESAGRLAVSKIDVCYLHRFEQCLQKQIIQDLVELKEKGIISQIGISIYEPLELNYIIENLEGIVDVVQLPFNVAVKEYWDRDLLQAAHNKFLLYARSIYLQGLLLLPVNHPKVEMLHGKSVLDKLIRLASEWNTDVKSLAWNFVQYHPFIDDFLVGCETLNQLKENVFLNQQEDKDYESKLRAVAFHANEIMTDPRRWQE